MIQLQHALHTTGNVVVRASAVLCRQLPTIVIDVTMGIVVY